MSAQDYPSRFFDEYFYHKSGIPPHHARILMEQLRMNNLRRGYVYNIPDHSSMYNYMYILDGGTECGWSLCGRDNLSQSMIADSNKERILGIDYGIDRDVGIMVSQHYMDAMMYGTSVKKENKVEPPKQKKAPKSVRHSYLKKRLLERLNKK